MVGTVIALHAALVHAMAHEMGPGGWLVVVRRSLAVLDSDPCYREVAEFIGSHCTALVSKAREPDQDMIMAASEVVVLRAWASCPGAAEDHDCTQPVTLSALAA